MLRLVILTLSINLALNRPDNTKYPFCAICTCETDNNTQHDDVTCSKDIGNYIFEDSFWINGSTGIPYDYNSMSFQNNHLVNLTYIFPGSNLIRLNLANNAIYRIGDGVFRNLQKMVILVLSNNDLEVIYPDALKGLYMEARLMPLKSLKEIHLDHNKLRALNKDVFMHCTDIEILDLSYNPLRIIDHPTLLAIASLSNLKELYLQYTEIKTLPYNLLHFPKHLEILDLSGNTGFDRIADTLRQARSLEKLYLNNTGFVNLTQENAFPKIPTLKILHMCQNQYLSHIDEHSISNLDGLQELRMSNNIKLISIHPMSLVKSMDINGGSVWPPIKKLYIENNKLSYLDSDLLASWDGLTGLDLRNNPWVCGCENKWLIEDLTAIFLKIDEARAKEVMCAAPFEMKSSSFYNLYKESRLKCLDSDDAKQKSNWIIIVGILAGVLIAIPTIMFLVCVYRRKWFDIFGKAERREESIPLHDLNGSL